MFCVGASPVVSWSWVRSVTHPVQVLMGLVEACFQLLATEVVQLSWFEEVQVVEVHSGFGLGLVEEGIWPALF